MTRCALLLLTLRIGSDEETRKPPDTGSELGRLGWATQPEPESLTFSDVGDHGIKLVSSCTVRFESAPGEEGTEVQLKAESVPPGGKVWVWIAKLAGDEAGAQVSEVLRRFKALMETGKRPTPEGQPSGTVRAPIWKTVDEGRSRTPPALIWLTASSRSRPPRSLRNRS